MGPINQLTVSLYSQPSADQQPGHPQTPTTERLKAGKLRDLAGSAFGRGEWFILHFFRWGNPKMVGLWWENPFRNGYPPVSSNMACCHIHYLVRAVEPPSPVETFVDFPATTTVVFSAGGFLYRWFFGSYSTRAVQKRERTWTNLNGARWCPQSIALVNITPISIGLMIDISIVYSSHGIVNQLTSLLVI